MIEWWYADNGKQAGPVDFDALTQLAQSGRVDAETLVWHDGLPSWQAIGVLPELRGLLPPRGAVQRPAHPAGMPMPPIGMGTGHAAQQQAAMYAPEPRQGMGTGMKIFIGLMCAVVGLAVLIFVVSVGVGVWKGYHNAQQAAEQRQAARQQPAPVAAPPVQPAPQLQPAATGTGNGTGWQNPLTGRTAAVNEEWSVQDQTAQVRNARFAYLFTADNQKIAAKIIGEDAPSGYSLENIAQAYRRISAGDIEFYGPEQFTSINGYRVWESDGKSRKVEGYLVHVQIGLAGTHCWTLVTLRPMSDASGEDKLDALRTQLWSTVQ